MPLNQSFAQRPVSIFSAELTDELEESILSFSNITGVPVTFFDLTGAIIWESNPAHKVCLLLDNYVQPESQCLKNLMTAAAIAANLGEPYTFSCMDGFINIAVSLIVDDQVIGCFVAGPLIMNSMLEDTIRYIFSSRNMSSSFYARLFTFLKNMKTCSPIEIKNLGTLLNCCLMSCLVKNQDYQRRNQIYREQLMISERIQQQKKSKEPILYPYGIEDALIKHLICGNAKASRETMAELLSELLVIESGNLDIIKGRLLEIAAMLSKTTFENTHVWHKPLELDMRQVQTLNAADTVGDLFAWTEELVEMFLDQGFKNIYTGGSLPVQEALAFINSHYMERITLRQVSALVHINASYFSTLFKNEMSLTFIDYLNDLRIRKGADLLRTTRLSILEISSYVGFEDQSYFTKVFKKIMGCTPNRYRIGFIAGKGMAGRQSTSKERPRKS